MYRKNVKFSITQREPKCFCPITAYRQLDIAIAVLKIASLFFLPNNVLSTPGDPAISVLKIAPL